MRNKQYISLILAATLVAGTFSPVTASETETNTTVQTAITEIETPETSGTNETPAMTETQTVTPPAETPAQTEAPVQTEAMDYETVVTETADTEAPSAQSQETQESQEAQTDTAIDPIPAEEVSGQTEAETAMKEENGSGSDNTDEMITEAETAAETEITSEAQTEMPSETKSERETASESSKTTDKKTETQADTNEVPPYKTVTVSSDADVLISGFHVDPSAYPAANISDNTNKIYLFCRNELGLNHAAACGVLGNVQMESNFDPMALGDGGTSYGICQWHLDRFRALISFCNGNGYDYNTVEGQLRYLKREFEGGYYGTYNYLLNVSDTAQGAYDAANYMCIHFESPDQAAARGAQRGNLAMNEFYKNTFEEDKVNPLSVIRSVRSQIAHKHEETVKEAMYFTGADLETPIMAKPVTTLFIRKYAAVDSEALCAVPTSGQVKIISEEDENGWCKVLYNRKEQEITGFMNREFLSTGEIVKEKAYEAVNAAKVSETTVSETTVTIDSKTSIAKNASDEKTTPRIAVTASPTTALFVRAEANADSKKIATLGEGQQIQVIEDIDENGWCKIAYTSLGMDGVGYVKASFLDINSIGLEN